MPISASSTVPSSTPRRSPTRGIPTKAARWLPRAPRWVPLRAYRARQAIPPSAAHPTNPNALLWNPAGSSFEEAWDRLKVDGVLAVVGGPDVFGQFLDIGYDLFFLSHAPASIPHGRPVFPGVPEKTPEALLAEHGMVPQAVQVLDEASHVTVTQWGRG